MLSTSAQRRLEFVPVAPSPARAFRPLPREALDLVCIEECGQDVQPRIHNRYAIVLLRSPAVVRLESSRSIVADRNAILLLPPGQLHASRASGTATSGNERSAVTLLLEPSAVVQFAATDRPAVVMDTDIGAQLASLVAQLLRPVRPAECDSTIPSVLEHVVRGGTSIISPRADTFAAQTLSAVRDYLRARETELVATQTLSKYSGLTETHLIRAFHREFGLPPHAYHMRLRLAHACDLLGSGLSVSTTAYECAFADQSHLSRKFKETYGMTPAAWGKAAATR